MERFPPGVTEEELQVSASMKGLLANQKAILWFRHDKDGSKALHEVSCPKMTPKESHEALVGKGLIYHTIAPEGDGCRIYVYDASGKDLLPAVTDFAKENHGEHQVHIGGGDFLGSWTSREEGAEKYRESIRLYEAAGGEDRQRRVAEYWRLYDHWRAHEVKLVGRWLVGGISTFTVKVKPSRWLKGGHDVSDQPRDHGKFSTTGGGDILSGVSARVSVGAPKDTLVKAWTEHVGKSVEQLGDYLGSGLPDGFSLKIDAVGIPSDGHGVEFRSVIKGENTGAGILKAGIDKDGRSEVKLVDLPDSFPKGFVRPLVKNFFAEAEHAGSKGVKLEADITVGAYAWAKFGFTPEPADWKKVREQLANYIDRTEQPLTKTDRQTIKAAITSDDPKGIWKLADLKTPVVPPWLESISGTTQMPLGQALLCNRSWHGKIDFADTEAMKRANEYMKPKASKNGRWWKAFDPDKHPRGHEGNAGQFASGGATTTAEKQQVDEAKAEIAKVSTIPKTPQWVEEGLETTLAGSSFTPEELEFSTTQHDLRSEFANTHAMTLDEYDTACQEKIEKLLDGATVWRRCGMSAFENLLIDPGDKPDPAKEASGIVYGRFANQFETGRSSGLFDTSKREAFEKEFLGFQGPSRDKDGYMPAVWDEIGNPHAYNPIYGYVCGKGDKDGLGSVPPWTETVHDCPMSHYGPIAVKFKDSIKERTTFTVGDSLDANHMTVTHLDEEHLMPLQDPLRTKASPINAPDFRSHNFHDMPRCADLLADNVTSIRKMEPYVEAQIYGQAKATDVERVVFYREDDAKTFGARLDAKGIPWSIAEHQFFRRDLKNGTEGTAL